MAPTNMVTVLEHCLVAPPPGSVSTTSLPLTFSDINWIGFPPVQRLVFYEHPISKTNFLNSVIPKLKNSLSLTLEHFWALAGKLTVSLDSSEAEISYTDGDSSVSLVFAESSFHDFDYLIGNQPRNCSEFHPLVAQLPPYSSASGSVTASVFALQVTLFPEMGICIGISNQHAAGDGSSIYAFVKAWSIISKQGQDATPLGDEYLPFYDRTVIRDRKELTEILWSRLRNRMDRIVNLPLALPTDTDKVRATFVIGLDDVRRLKDYVSSKISSLQHLSTFTVVCGYIWSCVIKLQNSSVIECEEEDECEYFVFAADFRARVDPRIPANYLGNYIIPCLAIAKTKQLAGEEGFLVAAESIGKAIHERLQNKEGVFQGLEKLFLDFQKMNVRRLFSVVASPRQNYYNIDFGWGEPKKVEFVTIDISGAASLGGSKAPGGIEIGLALPKNMMDSFTEIYQEGLNAL